ncbi:MAG: aspartate--tRNA ligase [Candidatus Tyloplasma litorale]|nr:MAG: aspartate--tRNA ligase [Mycoplasmatales bacterium]
MENNNFNLNKKNIGSEVELKGWINKSRRMGELIFFDIRNKNKLIQAVVSSQSKSFKIANSLRNEFVVLVKGKIIKRKKPNPLMETGDIEIDVSDLKIINKSIQTPMLIKEETDALEQKRLQYRYLDLRRFSNQEMLIKRSNFNKLIRNFFYENDFIEIETPIITKPTFGGAGEFKVISSTETDKYYSLVQSPQLYKQLLMYGGVNKYFQIAKCFRDEKSRSDRQIEFTQLDMELSFTSQKEIINLINSLMIKIFKEFKNINLSKIPLMTYKEAINNYGSDKPDIRFENKIFDLTTIFENTSIEFIRKEINKKKFIKAVFFEKEISNSEIKKIQEIIKSQGAKIFAWGKLKDGKISGSFKDASNEEINLIIEKMNINKSGTLFTIIDENKNALEFIGRIRLLVAEKLNMLNPEEFALLWVIDFPLFEKNSDGKIESVHNPFTSIKEELRNELYELEFSKNYDLSKLISNSYDIVLNGTEIGGGAIRISNKLDQEKIFEILGLNKEEIQENFGWFLESQEYGIPTHGGIALGIDRILSIILNKETIRDVIAFPKTSHGTDELTNSPIKLKK